MIVHDIESLKQKNSFDCGEVILKMVLSYFKIRETNFFSEEELNEKRGLLLFELATKFKEKANSMQPKIVFFNYSFFDDSFNNLSKEEKISYISTEIRKLKEIENFSKIDLRYLESILKCIEKDISLNHNVFWINHIEEILKDSPIVINITPSIFRRKKAKFSGHFILLTGFDENYFYYNDPTNLHEEFYGKQKKEKEVLMASLSNRAFTGFIYFTKNN